MLTKTVDINDAQKRLIELLSSVASGTEVILTEGNKPVARLLPIASSEKLRVAGLHTGMLTMSADFDEPLAEEFWLGSS